LLALLLLVIACGSAGAETPRPAESDPAGEAVTLTDGELSLARAEGLWQCEVGRHTYQDLEDIAPHRARFLAELGIDPAELDRFLAENLARPSVRMAMLDAYREACGD
jgi:hypothetical protein